MLIDEIFKPDLEIAWICEKANIALLVLFGSRAKGKVHAESDIDLAVKPVHGHIVDKLKLIFEFGELLKTEGIDLVVLTPETDPVLLYEIFMNGRPLYENSPELFEREKLRAWKLYLDTERLRRYQKEYLRRFAEEIK